MSYFKETSTFINQNPNLREPQIKGYNKLQNFFEGDNNHPAIAILPTGSGKTGLIGMTPYGIAEGRVLIVAPSLVIYDGITDTLDSGKRDNFWIKRGVILAYNDLPRVLQYQTHFQKHLLDESDIIITNIQKTYSRHLNSLINTVPNDYFDLIIFDEAHHCPASSYRDLVEYFDKAKVIKVTGTPFRSDGKKIHGEIVYEYSLGRAMAKNYVKQIGKFDYIPEKLTFKIKDKKKTYSIEEIMELVKSERDMISRGVAYSRSCSMSVVKESIKVLKEKREASSYPHKIIGVACSIEHAEEIKELYEECDIKATIVHSDLDEEDNLKNKRMFENDEYQAIINVGILGEGYDHEYISIAAIFRPFRTLQPYIQFIGRTLRIIGETDRPEIDNTAIVVHHKGLDLDELWNYYREEKQKAESILELEETLKEDYNKVEESGKNNKDDVKAEILDQQDGYFESDSFLEDIDIIANYQKAIEKYKNDIDNHISKLEDNGLEITDEIRKAIEDQVTGQKRKEALADKRPGLIWNEKDQHLNDLIYEKTPEIIEEAGFNPKGTKLLKYADPNYKWILKSGGKDNASYFAIKINTILKRKMGRSRKDGKWTVRELDIAIEEVEAIHKDMYGRLKEIKERRSE